METVLIDPTLEELVPRPSPARNLALLVVGVLVLATVWLSPPITGHSLGSTEFSMEQIDSHRHVLSTLQLQPNGWPRVTIDSVSDVPGASVAAVWVGLASVPGRAIRVPGSAIDSANYATAEAYVEAVNGVTDDHLVPVSVESGAPITMLILWQIDDCALLDSNALVEVELKTVFGSTETAVLSDRIYGEVGIESPAYDIDGLTRSGMCP